MKAQNNYYFSGNIEGEIAICNIAPSGLYKNGHKVITMEVPAKFCKENTDSEISINKATFNRLNKQGKITYKIAKIFAGSVNEQTHLI